MYTYCPLGVKRTFLAKEGLHPLLLLCCRPSSRAANAVFQFFVSSVVHTFEGIILAGRSRASLITSKLAPTTTNVKCENERL